MNGLAIENLQVILVEPSTAQQRIIRRHLESLGVRNVECLHCGKDVLAALTAHTPDLIISAMYLPDMTGGELLEAIRGGEIHPDVPYLLISSETHYRYLEPIRQAGAIGLLPKPFEREQLRTALHATLNYLDPGDLAIRHIAHEDLQVLVVDDSVFSRQQIVRVLEAMGIEQLTQAENGVEAFELVKAHFFDLIVTDLNMPKMDGREFIEHVRQESDQPSVPILMVSSEQDARRLAGVQQAGVSALCDKPFNPATIKQLIENIID